MDGALPKAYAVKHKDEAIRMASRSGGVFTALSGDVLRAGGVVYGCALGEDLKAVHIRADSEALRNRLRGSKYVQSEMGDMFRAVRADLKAGTPVLFSGTACQVAGLRRFLGEAYAQLLCVDIVCQGAASPRIWADCLRQQEKKHGPIVSADFRNKTDFSWEEHTETYVLASGGQVHSRAFAALFCGHAIFRPSCYSCPYKCMERPGDVTLADYWGVDKAVPGFNDHKGVSLVLIGSGKGEAAFERVREELTCVQTPLEACVQPSLSRPLEEPPERAALWQDYAAHGFGYIARKYGGDGWRSKAGKRIAGCVAGVKRRLGRWLRGR